MAICRKKIKGDALDEVQDETLGLRKRIVGRFADRTQMTMEAAFHTRNVGQIQDGTCNFPAQQARLGSRPQESRRRPAALLACSAREAPHSGRFRLRANRPATLGRGGGRAQAVFLQTLLSYWTVAAKVCRCGSSCTLSELQFARCCAAWLKSHITTTGLTTSTWSLLN